MIFTSGHLIPKFPEVRFHRTRIFVYYRSKKDFNQARHYYDVYLTSKHVNNDIGVIMDSVWNGKAKSELVAESVKKFENPVLRKLFAENDIL